MWEASWLLLGSCLGSRRASLWRQKYLLLSPPSSLTAELKDRLGLQTIGFWPHFSSFGHNAKTYAVGLHYETERLSSFESGASPALFVRSWCMMDGKQVCSDRKKTQRSHFTLAFPNSTWTLLQLMDKIHPRVYQANDLTKRWLYKKKEDNKSVYFYSVY